MHSLKEKNPTEYLFPFDRQTVMSALDSSLGKSEYRSMEFQWCDRVDRAQFFIPRICDSSTTNQAILYAAFQPSIGFSSYYRNGKRLPFYSDFQITVDSIESQQTRVSVRAKNTRVVTGRKTGLGHWGGGVKVTPVSPTTIEEYEILLLIGEELGVREEMPPINRPE